VHNSVRGKGGSESVVLVTYDLVDAVFTLITTRSLPRPRGTARKVIVGFKDRGRSSKTFPFLRGGGRAAVLLRSSGE